MNVATSPFSLRVVFLAALLFLGPNLPPMGIAFAISLEADGYHVFPGEKIQEALESAARNPSNKIVKVHAGIYRPESKRQALIWFNKMHEGVVLEAVGPVTLSAANPALSERGSLSYPAVVNHVVYFGDGVSAKTVLRGFRIEGANHFVTEKLTRQLEPNSSIPKNLFFFTDGGAIKIFGRSSPTICEVVVADNYASPCGAGISVQQEGFNQNPVVIENCVFLTNKTQVTGAAIDLLRGSAARITNCLFVGNVSNTGVDTVARRSGEPPFLNSGVITIFQKSKAWIQNCTFAGNRNGVDDLGGASIYSRCIFFENTIDGGLTPQRRYELDLREGGTVSGCLIRGGLVDPRSVISPQANVLNAPKPEFDSLFVPQAPEYRAAGYRPVSAPAFDARVR